MLIQLFWISLTLVNGAALSNNIISPVNADVVNKLGPLVVLPFGTFEGSNANGISSFKGIPYAQPPVGNLRLRYPVSPPEAKIGIQSAKSYGHACIQQIPYVGNFSEFPTSVLGNYVPRLSSYSNMNEDCLTINIEMPKGTKSTDRLPIVAWIHGGAFEVGASSGYDGSPIVQRSILLGTPIIYVSMNYRLNGFGFLGGKEVGAAGLGNLGLVDQREALKFINKYAHLFGGDKNKVTIFGESAGAVSVGSQMLHNKGNPEGLFHGAVLDSGSPLPVGRIEEYQTVANKIYKDVGCLDSASPLDCLRTVPVKAMTDAVNSVPGEFIYAGLNFAFSVTADGTFLKDPPQQMIARGEYSKIPMINSNCDDEGTFFSFISQATVKTDEDFRDFVTDVYLPNATSAELDSLMLAYPNDTSVGSPFNTGKTSALSPQFKRISAIQSDIWFQSARRYFSGIASGEMPVWSWLWSRNKSSNYLGSYHTSDLVNGFFTPSIGSVDKQLMDYLINFVVNLDPNDSTNPNLINWPQWTNSSRTLLELVDLPNGGAIKGNQGLQLSVDDFRSSAIDLVIKLFLKYPFSTNYVE